jgi:hypothetical protein
VILSRDLEAFEKAFYFVHSWEDEIRASEKDWQIAEYGLILQKYLNNDDFDIIGTRHFVMYDESALDIDKLIETYQDISKLLIIERFYDAYMAKFKIYDDSELKSFENTIQRAKDRRLRNSLENAITRYYIWSRDRNVGITDNYKDKEYDIFRLLNNPNGFTPEKQYCFVWKSRDEYGLYSFFVDDNGKVYESYDRSDSLFSKRESLRR